MSIVTMSDNNATERTIQKAYSSPELSEYGDIHLITLSTGPGINDSTMSGAFG